MEGEKQPEVISADDARMNAFMARTSGFNEGYNRGFHDALATIITAFCFVLAAYYFGRAYREYLKESL